MSPRSKRNPGVFSCYNLPVAKAKVGVLVGPRGRGSNMVALHEACTAGKVDAEIAVVIASTIESPALQRAAELGIRTAVVPKEDPKGQIMLEALRGCQVICLAGFLRLLSEEVLKAFPNRILNVHPALLPKFGGKGMYGKHVHEAVLAAGETESGVSVHVVTEHYDEGPVLLQKKCEVKPEDTPETLAARILKLEHEAYPEALGLLLKSLDDGSPEDVGPSVVRTDVLSSDPDSGKNSGASLDGSATPEAQRSARLDLPLQSPVFEYISIPIMRGICWILFTLLGPFKAINRKAIPRKGGLLILSNHRADVDPIVVQLACPRPIYFMGKSELFKMPVVGWLLRCFHAFPVKRGEPDRGAIKKAVGYTQIGKAVCVFPEGQLTETGLLQALKPGAALIVRMAGVPVICCGLRRTDSILPYGKVLPRPALGWVTCAWGEPRTFDKHAKTEDIVEWAEAELLRLSGHG